MVIARAVDTKLETRRQQRRTLILGRKRQTRPAPLGPADCHVYCAPLLTLPPDLEMKSRDPFPYLSVVIVTVLVIPFC